MKNRKLGFEANFDSSFSSEASCSSGIIFPEFKTKSPDKSSWPANPNQKWPKTKTKQHWHITIDRHTLLSTNYQLESKDFWQHRKSLLSE